MSSGHISTIRMLGAIAWLFAGVVAGFSITRVTSGHSGYSSHLPVQQSRSTSQAEEASESRSNRSKRGAKDDTIFLTYEQLEKLAKNPPRLEFEAVIANLNGDFAWENLPNDGRDNILAAHLDSVCEMLSFNPEESKKLRSIFNSHISKMIGLEKSSLSIKQTEPGNLVLDFDSLSEAREGILQDIRAEIEDSLGQSALEDLQVLCGLDDFAKLPGQSANVEMRFDRGTDGWTIWTVVPGPGARSGSRVEIKGDPGFSRLVEMGLELGNGGRYAHLKNRIPDTMVPRP